MTRFLAWALAIVCAIATLITLVPRFWSMSIDLATHYTFVHYIASNLEVMRTGGPEMNLYPGGEIMPQAGHAAAAIAGTISGSLFLGMQILLFVSILLIWTSIYSIVLMLGPRLGLTAAIILSVTTLLGNVARPLGSALQVHGWEVIVNFFFTHTIAQGLFWLLVVGSAWMLQSSKSRHLIAAVLAVAAPLISYVHLLPAVETLAFLGFFVVLTIVVDLLGQDRSSRSILMLCYPLASALALVSLPPYKGMRQIAGNNGYLIVDYLSSAGRVAAAAATVFVLSLLWVYVAQRRQSRISGRVSMGLTGLAISAPCLLQFILLKLDGGGSDYAVNKYAFGIITIALMMTSTAVGIGVLRVLDRIKGRPIGLPEAPTGPFLVPCAVVCACALSLAVFAARPSSYRTADVLALERSVTGLERSVITDAADRRNFAVGLPGGSGTVDYLFSESILGSGWDGHVSDTLLSMVTGPGFSPKSAVGSLVTGVDSPFDAPPCRKAGPVDELVVVDYSCFLKRGQECVSLVRLGLGGNTRAGQLSGFSVPESGGRWTDGPLASFRCRIPEAWKGRALQVTLENVGSFGAGDVQSQRIRVAAGRKWHSYNVERGVPMEIRLLRPRGGGPELVLEIQCPEAVSPKELGDDDDVRRLGLRVIGIGLEVK